MQPWIDWVWQVWDSIHHGSFPDLGLWSYILLGVLVATEGPLSTLVGAAAAAAGLLDVRMVLLATVAGNIAGDSIWYSVGYYGRMEPILRRGRWLGIKRHHIERLEREMHAHAAKLIVFAKLAYGLIVPTLVAAGMARVPLRRWFPVVFIVETLWSVLLVWVGYHAAGLIAEFEQGLRFLGAAVLMLLLGVVFWYVRRRIDRTEIEMDPLLHAAEQPHDDHSPAQTPPASNGRHRPAEGDLTYAPQRRSSERPKEHERA